MHGKRTSHSETEVLQQDQMFGVKTFVEYCRRLIQTQLRKYFLCTCGAVELNATLKRIRLTRLLCSHTLKHR